MRRREGRHGHRSSGGERGSGEEGRGVRGRRGEACGSRAGAACLIVNSPGLPMLTGPMVLVWFISFISPSTRSSTKQKERVCFPSPYTVMSSPLMACPSHTGLVCPPPLAVPQRSPPPGGACMMKFETTRPSYGCIPGLEQQGSRVRPTAPQGSGQQRREGLANSAASPTAFRTSHTRLRADWGCGAQSSAAGGEVCECGHLVPSRGGWSRRC